MAMLRALVAAMAMASISELAMGVNYDVGGPAGAWDLNTNYAQWVSGKTFHPNDTLTFTYTTMHDVLEVTSSAYSSCDASSTPISKSTSGKTVVKLSAAGKRYFICGVPTHCARGMKVEFDVVAAGGSSPSTPAASPSPSSPAATPPESLSPPAPSGAVPVGALMQAKVALGLCLGMMLMLLGI